MPISIAPPLSATLPISEANVTNLTTDLAAKMAKAAPIVTAIAAPADGSLSANQVALWFDATNGAAKLMIKGKSADGTVVTGSVTLT